jgi:hypothetical protein
MRDFGNRLVVVTAVAVATLGVHCAKVPAEPAKAWSPVPSAVVASTIPGYQHAVAASKVHLGKNVHSDVRNVYQRSVGDDGAFGVNSLNGMVIAVQHTTSPALAVAPYSADMATHSEYVKRYFLGAGIPADQVLGVVGSTKATGAGRADSPLPVPTIVGYGATLSRAVSGFHVVESFADWPSIPASLVADASAIAARLNDPVQGPSYLAKLPVKGKHRVRIHHTSGSIIVPTTFVAFASCDVLESGGVAHHFDISGAELTLPQEVAHAPGAYRPPRVPGDGSR